MATQAEEVLQLFSDEEKADIQGFITSGYGNMIYAAYLFLQIPDIKAGQAWLSDLLEIDKKGYQEGSIHISTARDWVKYKATHSPEDKPRTRLNVAFTYPGLQAMGLSEDVLCTFSEQFRDGMAGSRTRSNILGDVGESAPENWDVGGTNTREVHVFLALYGEEKTHLDKLVDTQRRLLATHKVEELHAEESGRRIGQDSKFREHFGFRDGLGQPKIRGIDDAPGVKTTPSGEFVLGYRDAYDFFPVTPLVPKDQDPDDILPDDVNPLHGTQYKDFGRNGSYVAYRKLEQDVAAFWDFIAENAKRIDGSSTANPATMVWLAAKCVGRWPSGVPLILSPDKDDLSMEDKDKDKFDYIEKAGDDSGFACPYGSHVRRSNPRDSLLPKNAQKSYATSDRHRLLRRGITYGDPYFDFESLMDVKAGYAGLMGALKIARNGSDDGKRGFHFHPVTANIQRQFEFVQQSWTNNPAFNGLFDNKDPLTGDNDDNPQQASHMAIPNKSGLIQTDRLPRFVKVRGGAYLFMPSLTALRYLAKRKK